MNTPDILAAQRSRVLFLIRYITSGLIGGAIPVLFLFVWVSVLGFERTYLVGVVFGFVLALVVTFALQKYWAFRDFELSRGREQLFSYTLVAVSGLIINTTLLAGAKALFERHSFDFFDGWYLIVQVGIVIIVALSNFVLNFFFTFRKAREQRLWDR